MLRRRALPFIVGISALLSACGGAPKVVVATEAAPVSAALREQTADQQVWHVLSRLSFGARPGDVERVRTMGIDRWIGEQLRPERIDDSRAEQFLSNFETQRASAADLQAKYPRPNQVLQQLGARGDRSKLTAEENERVRQAGDGFRRMSGEVLSARVARGLLSDRQLQEVMTDFWLNHFSVYIQKGGPEPYLIAEYENSAIRPNVLGRFRTLLGAVAHSPAMLYYLDNWESAADSTRPRLAPPPNAVRVARATQQRRPGQQLPRGAPGGNVMEPAPLTPQQQQLIANRRRGGLNENYGRELLELHTLGVDGGYIQQDVINVARAFTGWTLRGPRQGSGGSQFVPSMHDAGEKTVLGHRLAAGRGEPDGEDVLDIVARHPATAHFIAFKLARRFVSDQPPAELVERAAETFRRTDGDLREVVRTIVTSPEFFSHAAYRSKVKSPFEVVVSALRALGAQPDATPRTAMMIGTLGQPIYGHQAPNGWPETGSEWMNTGAILNRINFGLAIAANRIPGVSATGWPGADSLKNAHLGQQVDGVIAALLGGSVSPETRAVLMSGENPFLSSAAAMDTTARPRKPSVADPEMESMTPAPGVRVARGLPQGRAFGALPQLRGLPQIVGLALGSPEFQRR